MTYHVTAKPWANGWELHVDGVGVTQCHTLTDAESTVRDFIATWYDLDECTDPIELALQLNGLELEVRDIRARTEAATKAQVEAARAARDVIRKLRSTAGLSVTDVAAVMGISRGRVSQLSAPGSGSPDRVARGE